jgi:tetratricopeptide (TPR) repeat protein
MAGTWIDRRTIFNRTTKSLTQLPAFLLLFFNCVAQRFDPDQLKKQYDAVDEFVRIKYATIDSLDRMIDTSNDTIKVDCLIELYFYQLQLDNHIAFQSLQRAGQLARKIGYHKGEGRYLEYLGNYYMEMKDLPAAESALRQSVLLYKKYNYDREYYEALQTLGLCLYWQMKFDEAIRLSRETYEYLKTIPGNARIAYVHRRIGLVREAQGKYDEAFDYFMKDKRISDTVTDKKGSRKSYGIYINLYLGNLYFEIGDKKNAMRYFKLSADKAMDNILPDLYDLQMGEIHFMLKNLDSAMYYFSLRKNCWERYIKDSAILGQAIASCNIPIAKTFISQQHYDTAITLLRSAIPSFKGLVFSSDIYKYLGQACLAANRLNEALVYSQELMNMANYSGARPMLKDAAEVRWKIFDRLKMRDSAYFYLKIFKNVSDTLSADKQLRNIQAMEWQAADDRQRAEINLLAKEKIIHEKQRQILLIIIVSFALIAFLILLSIDFKRKHERIDFEKKADDLKMQALRAQMNPHFIFNSLNSINSFILNNNKEDASRYLTKFSRLMRLMLHHSQSSLITLQEELDALEIYIEMEKLRFNNHFEYSIYVPVEIDPSSYKVPPLIIQPFVENAIWHGLMHKKSKGSLMIEFFVLDEKDIFCRITDDGIGRKNSSEKQPLPGKTYKSVGMQITKERIFKPEKSNGVAPIKIMDLVNSDGTPGGTSVTIKLPEVYD